MKYSINARRAPEAIGPYSQGTTAGRLVFASGQELTPDYKHALCDILNQKVRVGQEMCTVSAAIGAYCRSVFDVLEGGTQAIKCYEL